MTTKLRVVYIWASPC